MIGGPTDILVEANIVRGQTPRDAATSRAAPARPKRLAPRRCSDDDLAARSPRPLRPTRAPRPRPAAARRNPAAGAAGRTAPCRCRQRRGAAAPSRARPIRSPDSPHELSRPNGRIGRDRRAAAASAPRLDIAAPRPMAPTLDIPAVKPPRARPPHAAAPKPRCAGRQQSRRHGAAPRSRAAPPRHSRPPNRPPAAPPAPARRSRSCATDPHASPARLASAPRINSVNGARDKAAKPEPAAAPEEGGAAFGSLEQEMANLLGRPTGKP